MTGTAVKRLKTDPWLSNWGINLGLLVLPSNRATIANTVLIPTKTTARRTDMAELNLSDSENVLY